MILVETTLERELRLAKKKIKDLEAELATYKTAPTPGKPELPLAFKRTNVTTGNVYIALFEHGHDPIFFTGGASRAQKLKAANDLIATWNTGPNFWHYELHEGPIPESQ